MTVTIRQLAECVRGEVLGDGEMPIANARTLAEAEPGDITFVENQKHAGAWHQSRASAAIVPASFPVNGRTLIRVPDPLMAFARIVQHLRGRSDGGDGTIAPSAHIHPSATIGEGVTIGPFVVVGSGTSIGTGSNVHAGAVIGQNCKLGSDVVIHPHVVLYDDCILGDRVSIHANSVIGADGFGYRTQKGQQVKVPQLGWVELGDDVEVGACSTIDRGTFGPTRIGVGTKIDNLVQVAHNVNLGKHNIIVAQVGIAGSVTTGDYVIMAGQAGIADHVRIGDRVTIGAKTGVLQDLSTDSRALGMPATAHNVQLRILTSLEKLPEIRKDVRRIKQHLGLEDE